MRTRAATILSVATELPEGRLTTAELKGFAKTLEEHLEGVIGIAAPVCNAYGDFTAAITMALPKARFERNEETLVDRVVLAARTVSERLGWQDAPARSPARTARTTI